LLESHPGFRNTATTLATKRKSAAYLPGANTMTRNTIYVGFVLSFCAVLAACESRESRYQNYEIAQQQGALGNWLPRWLPEQATGIREYHTVDRPSAWIKYDAPRGQSLPIDMSCRPVSEADLKSSVFEIAPPQWWPRDLARVDLAVASRWNLLACDEAFVARSAQDDLETVYVWRTLE
jgi:hypothetical protein